VGNLQSLHWLPNIKWTQCEASFLFLNFNKCVNFHLLSLVSQGTPADRMVTIFVPQIQLESFSPDSSSTSSRITCSDDRCTAALQTGEAVCQTSDSSSSPCGYTFTYGDGSGTSGYYVSDTMFFETVMGNEQTANSSASIVFGYSFLGVLYRFK
jgi:hypothetical protein